MWRSPSFVAEKKENGERHTLYIDDFGLNGTHLYSRGDFPRIDKATSFPHIARHESYRHFERTVFDGELIWPHAKNLQQTSAFCRMLPINAVNAQVVKGKLNYHVFDLLFLRGRDLKQLPYYERRELLEATVAEINNCFIIPTERSIYYRRQFYHTIVYGGGEGIVLKDINQPYGRGWVKIKKRFDYSVIISGFNPGKAGTKYETTLGALCVSVYDGDELKEVATTSGMSDEMRHEFWDNQDKYRGMVIDVYAQEITEADRLLHPVFHQFRTDLAPGDCTLEKLKTDIRIASYWDNQMDVSD